MGKTVVVGWDGSGEGAAALDWAVAHAERHGSPVRIVTALESTSHDLTPRPQHSHHDLRASMQQQLVAVREVRAAAHPSVEFSSTLLDDSTVDALVKQSQDADLLVLGSRGSGGVLGRFAGSLLLDVVAHAQCPLVAVPQRDGASSAARGVVVGTDGSADSERAVTFAFEQATALGQSLAVLHTWHRSKPTSLAGVPLGDVPDPDAYTLRQHDVLVDWLAPWTKDHPTVEVDVRVVHGDAAHTLVEQSRTASLLVVGCRGRGGFRRRVLGSVSEGVLHLAAVPVAVVPGPH